MTTTTTVTNAEQIGELVVSTAGSLGDPLGLPRLHIDQADPVVWVSESLLMEIQTGVHPDVMYGDGILTIHGTNATVSYGLGPLDSSGSRRIGRKSA